MYTIHSSVEGGEEMLEGRRKSMLNAFRFARLRWREYGGLSSPHIKIIVRWNGTLIADDPVDFHISRQVRKYHAGLFAKMGIEGL